MIAAPFPHATKHTLCILATVLLAPDSGNLALGIMPAIITVWPP